MWHYSALSFLKHFKVKIRTKSENEYEYWIRWQAPWPSNVSKLRDYDIISVDKVSSHPINSNKKFHVNWCDWLNELILSFFNAIRSFHSWKLWMEYTYVAYRYLRYIVLALIGRMIQCKIFFCIANYAKKENFAICFQKSNAGDAIYTRLSEGSNA